MVHEMKLKTPDIVRLIAFLFVMLYCFFLFSSSRENRPGEHQLEIQIQGLMKPEGYVRIAVFNTPQSFLTSSVFISQSVEVNDLSVSSEISLPPGRYAISAYHDLNNDSELNLNFLGIPKEPYGFSNNPKRGIGPASYEASSFCFEEGDQILVIKLK